MNTALFVLGALVAASTWATLLATFVLPRGQSVYSAPSRLTTRMVRLCFVGISRMLPSFGAKDSVLALVGPIALLAQLALILGSIVVGFAFMDLRWSGSFGLAFGESSSAVFTLGLSRIAGSANDVVLVLAAASGAIAIALQIGYLPTIYQSFARRETLVTLMESRAGIPAWGPEVLIRHQLVATLDALPGLYRAWEGWAAEVAESHTTQPVLMFFRSPEPGFSWVLALLAILDAAALHLAVAPDIAPSEARLCLRMGFTALNRLGGTLGWAIEADPHPDAPIALEFSSFEAAFVQLKRFDFPCERSAVDAWPHFKGWRVNYEQMAYRFADYLMAPHSPWSGPRRHLDETLVLPDRPPHRNPNGDLLFDFQLREGSE
ncbi:MAG TPA: hypothetical protein VG368_04725 [Acidimicrobiales bacterium]|nr:hypothetical protein [Acidimicrobiales bacterium]